MATEVTIEDEQALSSMVADKKAAADASQLGKACRRHRAHTVDLLEAKVKVCADAKSEAAHEALQTAESSGFSLPGKRLMASARESAVRNVAKALLQCQTGSIDQDFSTYLTAPSEKQLSWNASRSLAMVECFAAHLLEHLEAC